MSRNYIYAAENYTLKISTGSKFYMMRCQMFYKVFEFYRLQVCILEHFTSERSAEFAEANPCSSARYKS